MGNLSENLCLGVGHLLILLEVIDIATFSILSLNIVIAVYRYIKNIFNKLYALKGMCDFSPSLTTLPYSIFCLCVRNWFPIPAIKISLLKL